ncbi:MAG: hypothetical protein HY328_02295 [Chloroflexi bacterium]|nr:hypothetical protein [Chloroflexota bacterium]
MTPAQTLLLQQTAVWPDDWFYFAGWQDLVFAGLGLMMGVLLVIWWRQQSKRWYSIFAGTLLLGMLLNVSSYFLFVVPPHYAGCPNGCMGRLGYPLPFATVALDGEPKLYLVDFLLNLLLLWLLWLGGSVLWRVLSEAVELRFRTRRFRLVFFLVVAVLPWAALPRYFDPPQVELRGEDMRISINARRAAELTYDVTGLWIQRLAVEDIRYAPLQVPSVFGGIDQPRAQVCLRGYTWFYIPWQRYLVTLDRTGVTALNMQRLGLEGSCWGIGDWRLGIGD